MFEIPSNLLEPGKICNLMKSILIQFHNRVTVDSKNRNVDYCASISTKIENNDFVIQITRIEDNYAVHIPMPFKENGVMFIEQNGVRRSVCSYLLVDNVSGKDRAMTYLDVIYGIIFGDLPYGIVPNGAIKEKLPFIRRIAASFANNITSVIMYQLQKAVNEVVNIMPIHETMMNSWVMNQRVFIVDQSFNEIRNPEGKLKYQVDKSAKLFNKYHWTPIGLSDGVLSDRNYSLKVDLRRTIPFGRRMHNPARNLYSTLRMRGDEQPLIRSESGQRLIDNGISRTGWNLFTMFVDVPDVWEDQIIVNAKHANKSIEYSKRFQCFGELQVKVGEKLEYNQILSISESDCEPIRFDVMADESWVESIVESTTVVGATPTKVNNVIIKFRRSIKDGVKITNCAANKGVIRLVENLGVAIDPRNGNTREIDVIVSSRAVIKRKNYTQILEALANNINGECVKVYPDDINVDIKTVEDQLKAAGFPRSGEWMCNTVYGNLTGVCGKIFWGVTHDVEDMLWDENDTTRRNGREIRVAGLKFSHVEFRALTTRFGKENSILDEIMSYAQGGEDLSEMLSILESKRGVLPVNKPIVDVKKINPVDQLGSTMTDLKNMEGTIADVSVYPEGFVIKLPIEYQVVIGEDKASKRPYVTLLEGWPFNVEDSILDNVKEVHRIDKIYVPNANLRRPWRHRSGKYGLTDIASALNNIVAISHRHLSDPEDGVHMRMLYSAVSSYFKDITNKLCSKRGEISTHGMSIRYPFSSKAVATLSNSLPRNVVQIHRNMAKTIGVKEGDIVLVERFPCLGFMSVRPQKVAITDDPWCKYTIRASKNSLGSLSLDFDGDVIYLASFHTDEAKRLLMKEWKNPNKSCYDAIQELNGKMGKPHTKTHNLQDYNIHAFTPLTVDTHSEIVEKLTGVKSHTGPVIALAYNVMRIIENSNVRDDIKTQVAVETFLDKVGNSVFKQKHGAKSLHSIVVDAICCGDVETLVTEGFERGTSTIICDTIRDKAREIGVRNLRNYHEFIKTVGASNIINRIVREQNKIYFASRSNLEGCELLYNLNAPAVDIPSKMFKWILTGRIGRDVTPLEKMIDRKCMSSMGTSMKGDCLTILEYVDSLFSKGQKKPKEESIGNSE